MADVKHIVIAIMGSVILLGLIAVWVGHKTGEVALLPGAEEPLNEAIPGPLEATEANETNKTDATNMNEATGITQATFKTTKGDITLELYGDKMPITVGNFTKLAKEGFYNGTKFHRVIDGFMIQGGDPNSKGSNTAVYGQGGPGYTIQDEFVADPRLTNVKGTIAMANTGQPNSGGSQWFINLVDNTGLDYDKPPQSSSHPVFGRVIAGMDIVEGIGKVETSDRDLPVEPIIINEIVIN